MPETKLAPGDMSHKQLIDAVRPHETTQTILFQDAELIRELVRRFEAAIALPTGQRGQ